METYQLLIKANYRLGVLERILRVVRHRGGYITAMTMSEVDDKMMKLTLDLSSINTSSSTHTLSNTNTKRTVVSQLSKLADIISVN